MKRFLISLALTALLPATAMACEEISSNYKLCLEGTPWETAEIMPNAEGATFIVRPFVMDYIEPYAGRSDGPLAGDLDQRNDFFDFPADTLLLRESLTGEDGRQAELQIDEFGTFDDRVSALMLVDIEGVRIQMLMNADAGTPAEDMRRMSVALFEAAGLICPGGCY